MANTPFKKQNLQSTLVAFGLVGIMLAALAAGKQALGSTPGDHCNQTDDVFPCKWRGVCIGRKCYQSCSQDSDCPSEWNCGTTDVTVETQTTFGRDKRDDKERICFAPKGSSKKK